MTDSMSRIYAIFQKDMKDLFRNLFVLSVITVPIIYAVFFKDRDSLDISYTIISITFALVTVFIQSALIAEEKEKNTLRGLILSPATTLEILIGKSILTFLMTIGTVIVCIFIIGYQPKNLTIISLALFISAIFYLGLGTLLGLYTKSVTEASVLSFPIMFIFGFPLLIQSLIARASFLKPLEYLPNIQLLHLATIVEEGSSTGNIFSPFMIILAWTVLCWLLVFIAFNKRGALDH
ncbi:ABC transporter permease [Bacillus carboniphilus]|uniref:ABC transporter permease n=1 Tax=Bacillus carboniphilus TaxID=86663 RepID=A0ABY9JV17_9BACI|nr:ABC transporter permease [Bacillus carboniphilus]WLR42138.1 ABC transporter permease [Bacillus carboniphilus]